MIIKLEIYPDAFDEKDCIPEAMSYRAVATSWEDAEMKLGSLQRVHEKDMVVEAQRLANENI